MAQIIVQIDEKTYRMACAPGDEEHLFGLAQELDRRVADLKAGVGDVGEQRLLLMAAMAALDELEETRAQLISTEERVADLENRRGETQTGHLRERAETAAAIEGAADRIERLAAGLELARRPNTKG